MAEPDVAIGEAELNRIGEYVQSHLSEWMDKLGVRPVPDPVTNTQLLERVVRVEEELKAQREVMTVRFNAIDDRFEAVNQNINVLKWFVVTSFVVLGAAISLLAVLS